MRQRDFLPKMNMGMRSALDINLENLQHCIRSNSLHAIFDSFHDGIVIYDPDGLVQFMNFAAERINQVHRYDFIALHYNELFQRSALNYHEFGSAIAQGMKQISTPNANHKIFITQIQSVPTTPRQNPYTILLQYDPEQRDAREQGNSEDPRLCLSDPQQYVLHLSPVLSRIADIGVRAFRRNARLLLLGEPGVGKTAIAKHIHLAAGWSNRPFIHINCSSIPEALFEHEMWGYEGGTFTGAWQNGKKGCIESAAGGTLFLDEVSEIPLPMQAKLLKFLEDGSIQAMGSPFAKKVQVQVMAASNQDLRCLVERGQFRADLYYRLCVLPIEIPPLRSHLEDLPMLMQHLLEYINQQREEPLILSNSCRTKLLQYHYPGNIRELVNIFERLAVLADDVAEEQHLPTELLGQLFHLPVFEQDTRLAQIEGTTQSHSTLKGHVQQFERDLILKSIEQHGTKTKAAQYLDIDVATLTRKLQRSEN